jgi:hypothetical protein
VGDRGKPPLFYDIARSRALVAEAERRQRGAVTRLAEPGEGGARAPPLALPLLSTLRR